ncbi:hypothetical protein Sjap_011813 [Stephania japonica]|uniref:Transposase n=1 Tax=Stephania japonica TaxID=461633 RepID=A0AAP0JDU6_9MAGN
MVEQLQTQLNELSETKGDSSFDRDDECNDKDCRSKDCIDQIECNDGHIFDINKPPIFYDNGDAIVEEKVVLGDDGRVLEVTQLTSIRQVSAVVLCDEASSTKIRDFQDEVEETTPRIYVSPVIDGFIEGEFEQDLSVFEDFMKVYLVFHSPTPDFSLNLRFDLKRLLQISRIVKATQGLFASPLRIRAITGQPIGENSDKVSSYMGALGRDMVRIIVPDWRLVTQEAKEELWKLLKLRFDGLEDDMKKKIVQHIGTLWRSWKSRVTSDLKQALEDGWSDDEINSKLQPEGVDLADWFTFRKERESTAFKETSKKFKELRSKHKLPHTMSRKGYARLEEEMKAKSGKADISRADLWIEGHKNKKGQPHNDEIAGVVEKINECQRRSSASSSQSINKDPIAQVFGPEHQGRVRGLGFGVTPSNVRATTQSTILVRKLQADFRRLEEKHEQLAELIRSQQMPLSSRQQQNNPPNICGKKCMILDWLSPKKIVGEGEVETIDPMHLVDGIPIGGNAYLVYVERVFEPNAFLWRNQNNWTTLDNALGEVIPWPKEAVALGRFLDMGPWAVDLILALDKVDLVKDAGHIYFIRFLDSIDAYPEHRAMAAFVLAQCATAFVAPNSRVLGGQDAGFGAWGCFAAHSPNWACYQEKLPQNMIEVAKQDKVANCEDDQVSKVNRT